MVAQKLAVQAVPPTLFALEPAPPPAAARPSGVDCLRCQLGGRPRVDCLLAAPCARTLSFPMAPLLVAGWIASALAFLLTL
jgi:hypothetical protein